MARTERMRVRVVCTLCVALAPALAHADPRGQSRRAVKPHAIVAADAAQRGCTVEDALASQRAPSSSIDSAPAEAAVAAEAARELPSVALPDVAPPDVATHLVPAPTERIVDGAGPAAMREMPARTAPLRFFDRDSLRAQIQSIRRLPLVRLFDNRQMSIYLGIDRKGVAGLHLQQRRPDESVPMDDAAPPVDIPLRSVPIDAR